MPSITLNKLSVYPVLDAEETKDVKTRVILGEKGITGSNATSSLKDEIFSEYRDHKLTSSEKKELSNWKSVFKKSRETIEQHLEKRVSLFFMQAVNCFGSDSKYEEGHTIHQGFDAHKIGSLKFEAAHHATTPCLFVTSKITGEKTVFLYRSSIYDESNATLDMVKQVNQADSAIDGGINSNKLRKKTIKLLNATAKEEVTPPEAISKFLKELIKEIDKQIDASNSDEVKDVLELYLKKAGDLKKWINDPANIDLWLNLQIENAQIHEERITYKELIRKKIAAFPLTIYNQIFETKGEVSLPNHFYDLFYYKILKNFEDEKLQKLEKATGLNFEKLKEKVGDFSSSEKARAIIRSRKKEINRLVREIDFLISKKQKKLVNEKLLDEVLDEKNNSLRPILYRFRYEMIAADQKVQSIIKSRIEDRLNKIKGSSKIHNFEDCFFYLVLKNNESKSDRRSIGKLLNVSYPALKQKIRELEIKSEFHDLISSSADKISKLATKIKKYRKCTTEEFEDKIKDKIQIPNRYNKKQSQQVLDLCYLRIFDMLKGDDDQIAILKKIIGTKSSIKKRLELNIKSISAEKFIQKQIEKIESLVKKSKKDIRELNNKMNELKGELLEELRKANGMDRASFLKQYNSHSSSMLDLDKLKKLETNQSQFTPKIVKAITAVFEISPTLFFPGHFAE